MVVASSNRCHSIVINLQQFVTKMSKFSTQYFRRNSTFRGSTSHTFLSALENVLVPSAAVNYVERHSCGKRAFAALSFSGPAKWRIAISRLFFWGGEKGKYYNCRYDVDDCLRGKKGQFQILPVRCVYAFCDFEAFFIFSF